MRQALAWFAEVWLALVLAAATRRSTRTRRAVHAAAGPAAGRDRGARIRPPARPEHRARRPAGIPFSVTVNACDDSWTLVTTVTHAIRILSSDASASLPAAAQLVGGHGELPRHPECRTATSRSTRTTRPTSRSPTAPARRCGRSCSRASSSRAFRGSRPPASRSR